MRVSVNKYDVGYKDDFHLYNAYLNGEKVSLCQTADEEDGYILRYKDLDKHSYGHCTEMEELYGEVKIIKDDD